MSPMHLLEREQWMPQPIEEVWDFFSTAKNLNRMTPDFLKFEILRGGEEPMFAGQIIEYRIEAIRGIKQLWITEITRCEPLSYFIDEQRIGPYRLWHHLHRFEEDGQGVRMLDRVHYQLPFGILGQFVHAIFVRRRLRRIFDYRGLFMQQEFNASPASQGASA